MKKNMIIVEFDSEKNDQELQEILGLLAHHLYISAESQEPVKVLSLSERAEKQLRSMIVGMDNKNH